jgi:hypothetical protein
LVAIEEPDGAWQCHDGSVLGAIGDVLGADFVEAIPNFEGSVVRQSMALDVEDLTGDCLDWADVLVAAEAETNDLAMSHVFGW